MKKFFLLAFMMAVSAGAPLVAAAESVNVVHIERADGIKEQLLLDEKLNIKLGENNTLLLVHPEITVEYELGEVKNLTFAYAADPELYIGDHKAGIAAPAAPENAIRLTESAITAGADEAIAVFDLKGCRVASAKGSLNLKQLPAGAVYIVRIGSTSLKIKL